jgi:type VI secretion protein, VC_A0114 family
MIELRQALSLVLDQTVIQIDLRERKYGIKTALISDKTLLHKASFVLAVHANLPAEQIRAQFPTQTKIGPVEKIRDLVNLQLPGVVIKPLPVAPRELPYNAGYNYFEIDTQHVLWKDLGRSAGLALHVAGDFPGLELLFWAIRK